MRLPRPRLTVARMMGLVGLMALVAWWLTDQPRRRGKAVATTKRVGGVVQLDDEYQPVIKAPPPAPARSAAWLANRLGPEVAHPVVINLDRPPGTDAALV